MLIKTGRLEVTDDVRSVPLGQKRKKGRPKRIPNCLVKSPIRVLDEALDATTTTHEDNAEDNEHFDEPPAEMSSLRDVECNKNKTRKRKAIVEVSEVPDMDLQQSPINALLSQRLKPGLAGSKPAKKKAKTSNNQRSANIPDTSNKEAEVLRPPPINCKKRKGSCNHEVAFGLHYSKLEWVKYAAYISSKKTSIEIDPNYIP